jgi:tryptophan synthase alpha chain
VLAPAFERARSEARLAFIPYVMAGDPDLETTVLMLHALSEAGADIIELGVPYGDPLADGPSVAAAGQRALASGTTLPAVLALLRLHRDAIAPVVLFTYYNPVYQYGLQRFARDAAAAGCAGVIVPDLALEETASLRRALKAASLDMPLLVAPTTPAKRARRIVKASTGFVYVVSRLGVTGAKTAPNMEPLYVQLAELRAMTDLPLAVGFGISRAQDVARLRGHADAFVVGSALIDAYAGYASGEVAHRVEAFVGALLRLDS